MGRPSVKNDVFPMRLDEPFSRLLAAWIAAKRVDFRKARESGTTPLLPDMRIDVERCRIIFRYD